jgi:hypothetical protein
MAKYVAWAQVMPDKPKHESLIGDCAKVAENENGL